MTKKANTFFYMIDMILIMALAVVFALFLSKSCAPEPARAEIIQVVNGEITAYSPTRQQCDSEPLINAMGRRVQVGDVACPAWLEFGQKVRIAGRVYVCKDRMAKRYRYNRNPAYFDLFMWSREDALQWGRKALKVEIL